MKRYNINKLNIVFQSKFRWNKARVRFLTRFITSLIVAATVNLARIALMINPEAKRQSNYRGLQRFFQNFKMNYEEYAIRLRRIVLSLLPKQGKYYLVMDRTNWKFGKTAINILMLGVIHKKNCFPLYWELLDKEGSSSTKERKELLEKAINLLGRERIAALLCDREFIGVGWFKYLIDQKIEFHIRIPKQIKYGSILLKHRKSINYLFRFFKENVKVDYHKAVNIMGFTLYVSAMKSKKGYCVVVSSKDNINSLEKYRQRWTIENMFGAFKTRGFNFESTHMKGLEKLKKLIVLVSIAYSWCVMVGLWITETVTIRIMTHGRKLFSDFRKGFDYLTTFINKMITGSDYNNYEFYEVIKILPCT